MAANRRGQQLTERQSSSRQINNAAVLFNSIALTFFNAGSITGSLIGSLIVGSSTNQPLMAVNNKSSLAGAAVTLRVGDNDNETNSSCHSSANTWSSCGVDHCPFVAEHVAGFTVTDHTLIYLVAAISFLLSAVAIVIAAFLLPLPPGYTPSDVDDCCPGCIGGRHRRKSTGATHCCPSWSCDCQGTPSGTIVVTEQQPIARLKLDNSGKETRQADNERSMTSEMSMRARIVDTFSLLSDHRLQLLIPSIILMGVLQSFSISAFNQVNQSHNNQSGKPIKTPSSINIMPFKIVFLCQTLRHITFFTSLTGGQDPTPTSPFSQNHAL